MAEPLPPKPADLVNSLIARAGQPAPPFILHCAAGCVVNITVQPSSEATAPLLRAP